MLQTIGPLCSNKASKRMVKKPWKLSISGSRMEQQVLKAGSWKKRITKDGGFLWMKGRESKAGCC